MDSDGSDHRMLLYAECRFSLGFRKLGGAAPSGSVITSEAASDRSQDNSLPGIAEADEGSDQKTIQQTNDNKDSEAPSAGESLAYDASVFQDAGVKAEEAVGDSDRDTIAQLVVQNISINSVTITPYSYSAKAVVDYSYDFTGISQEAFQYVTSKNDFGRWLLFYKEGDGVITGDEGDYWDRRHEGWHVALWRFKLKSGEESGTYSEKEASLTTQAELVGEELYEDSPLWTGLKPGTAYTFYTGMLKNWDKEHGYHIKQGKGTFTTSAAINSSQVSSTGVAVEGGTYDEKSVKWVTFNISNPGNERIEGFYCGNDPQNFMLKHESRIIGSKDIETVDGLEGYEGQCRDSEGNYKLAFYDGLGGEANLYALVHLDDGDLSAVSLNSTPLDMGENIYPEEREEDEPEEDELTEEEIAEILNCISFNVVSVVSTGYTTEITLRYNHDYEKMSDETWKKFRGTISPTIFYKKGDASIDEPKVEYWDMFDEEWKAPIGDISITCDKVNSSSEIKFILNGDELQFNYPLPVGLNPDTKYSYYAAVSFSQGAKEGNTFYIKNIEDAENSFTTGSAVNDSQVSITGGTSAITIKDRPKTEYNSYAEKWLTFRLDNPQNENIVSFYAGNNPEEVSKNQISDRKLNTRIISEWSNQWEGNPEADYWEWHKTDGTYNISFGADIGSNVDLYAVVHTGTNKDNYLTTVRLNDTPLDLGEGAALNDETVTISQEGIPGGLMVKPFVKGLSSNACAPFARVYIREHGDGSDYSCYRRNYDDYLEREFVESSWAESEDGMESEIIFRNGETVDDNPEGYPHRKEIKELKLSTAKHYDIKVVLTYDGDDRYEKAFENVSFGEDQLISNSEFDPGLLMYLKNYLDIYYADDEYVDPGAAKNVYYTDEGINQSGLDLVRSISVDDNRFEILSLNGIRHLTGLTNIDMEESCIEDIRMVSQAKSLRSLRLYETKVKDMPDLSGLENLQGVSLEWNWIPKKDVTADKFPAKLLPYSYEEEDNETEEEAQERLQEAIEAAQKNQHELENFNHYETSVKLPSENAEHPFTLHMPGTELLQTDFLVSYKKVKTEGKVESIKTGGKVEYYLFQAYKEGEEAPDDDESFGFLIGPEDGDLSEDSKTVKNKFETAYGINTYIHFSDSYDLSANNIPGVLGYGSQKIHYRILKVAVSGREKDEWDGEWTWEENHRLLLYENTVDVVYKSPEDVDASEVKVSPSSLELKVGEKAQLSANVLPEEVLIKTVTWKSGDPAIASVDESGIVTAVEPGVVNITATSDLTPSVNGICRVTVKGEDPGPVEPESLTIEGKNGITTTFVGNTLELVVKFSPADAVADASKIVWSSSDDKTASLSGNIVTGLKEGSAVITASYKIDDKKTLSAKLGITVRRQSDAKKIFYTVTFVSENKVTVIHTEQVMEGQTATEPATKPEKAGCMFIGWGVGETLWDFTTPINAEVTLNPVFKKNKMEVNETSGSGMDAQPASDLKKEGEKVTGSIYLVKGQTYTTEENAGKDWKTENTSVAKVGKNSGKITAAGKGSTKVSNSTHEYTVFVVEPSIAAAFVAGKKADVKPNKVEILVGQTAEYKVDGITENADKYSITWYSSNTKIARVNNGVVTGIAKGSANISAFVGGKEYKGKVTVKDVIKAPAKISGKEAEIDINALKAVQLKFETFKAKNSTWEAAPGYTKLEVSAKDKKGNPTAWKNDTVEITNKGKIKGIGENTTKIVGTDANGGTITLTVNVKVIRSKATTFINEGKTETLKFAGVSNKKAEWASSDPSKVTVDNSTKKGLVKGVQAGSSEISCSVNEANNVVFETIVYCEKPQLKADAAGKLKIDAKGTGTLSLDAGEVYVIGTEGISQTPAFKSSNKKAVFVDENGVIYARGKGKKANITAKVNGKTLKIKVSVNK